MFGAKTSFFLSVLNSFAQRYEIEERSNCVLKEGIFR